MSMSKATRSLEMIYKRRVRSGSGSEVVAGPGINEVINK
jgi:hypothetical protein